MFIDCKPRNYIPKVENFVTVEHTVIVNSSWKKHVTLQNAMSHCRMICYVIYFLVLVIAECYVTFEFSKHIRVNENLFTWALSGVYVAICFTVKEANFGF